MEYFSNILQTWLSILFILSNVMVDATSIDCSQYTSCTQCSIRAPCGWNTENEICNSLNNADPSQVWISETPGCPDNDAVTILSFGTNEMIKYSMDYIICSEDVSSVEDAELVEFSSDNDNCRSSNVDLTFWIKNSNDDTMSYEILGRLDNLDDTPPCHMIIKEGVLTSITCPTNSRAIDSEKNKDRSSTSLYAALKLLLPRTERQLFNENNDITDEDGKGYVLSNRKYSDGNLERDYDLSCFDPWESDFIPESMNHYEKQTIDDASKHITSVDFNEKFVFSRGDKDRYTVYYVEVTLTMTHDAITVNSDILDELMNLLYTDNSDDYYTKELSLHDWNKAQYSDSDYKLHISDTQREDDENNEEQDEARRRMLHVDPLATYFEELYESPSIFGVTFTVELDAVVGIDCLWDWLPGQSRATINPVFPVCWLATTTCLWNTFGFPGSLVPILDCCNDFYRDLADCDIPMHDVAEDNLVNCINGYPGAGACATIQDNFNNLDIYDMAAFLGVNLTTFIPPGVTVGDFNPLNVIAQIFSKDQYCTIDCVNGGGIIGGATFTLKANGGAVWDYTVPFDKTAEFEINIASNFLGLNIPTFLPGVVVELEFDFDITVGLAYNEFNSIASDGSGDTSYNEEAVPYAKIDLIFQAGLEISVPFVGAGIFGEGRLTVLDFNYTLGVELVGFVTNPASIPNVQVYDNAVWKPISFEWSVQWEVCFEIQIGPIEFEIACEGGTIFRRRRQLSLSSSTTNKFIEAKNINHLNKHRLLLASESEPGKTDKFINLNFGGLWILEDGDPVYNVKAQICFQIIANDDLEDYIIFNDISNAIFSIGVTREWVSEYITMQGTLTIVYLNSATISVTPNTNAQNEPGNLGCDDGLPFEIYVESTMCLELHLVTRFESDIDTITHRLDTSDASKQHFLEQLSLLLLDASSPYKEFIQSIDTTSGVGNVMDLGSELYGDTPPTSEPTLLPTMAPTLYNPIIPCLNSPCDCSESNLNCKVCHTPEGCNQCLDGYFKASYSHKCQHCQTVFDGCVSCQDFEGCGQCQDGWLRLHDDINDLYYCEEDKSTHIDDDWRFDRIPTCQCPYQCVNTPCSCGELEHCNKCSYNGCDECEHGYFKKDYDSPCLHCQDTFGDSCMFCQDFNGCGQCINGYQRLYDDACGLWYCKQN